MNNYLSATQWHKSSWSGAKDDCVEIAHLDAGMVGVRDSKNPAGQHLVFAPDQWDIFLSATKISELGLVSTE